MIGRASSRSARQILLAGVFVNRIAYFLGTYGTIILLSLGVTAERLPATLLMVGVSSVAGSLLGGVLGDRFGRGYVAVVSIVVASACALALSLPGLSIGGIELLASLNVLAMSVSIPPVLSSLTDSLEMEKRVTAFASYRLALNLGTILCALLAAFLLTGSVEVLLRTEALVCLVAAIVVGIGIRLMESASRNGQVPSMRVPVVTGSWLGQARSLLPAAVLAAVMTPVFGLFIQFTSTVPLILGEKNEFPLLVLVNATLIICFQIWIGRLASKIEWVIPLTAGVALVAAGLFFLGTATGVVGLVVGVIVFTFGEMLFAPVTNAAASALSDRSVQSAAQGLIQASQAAGFSFGPAVGAYYLVRYPDNVWFGSIVIGVVCCVAIGISYWGTRKARRETIYDQQ
ncbi:MFS transporter [Micrococcus luteus]|uniref:MFS transporter n=1 Tax=Micrococcus luteus TaxID=1270 RepID=UPI00387A11DB